MKDKKLDTWLRKEFNAKSPFLEQLPGEIKDKLIQFKVKEFGQGDVILSKNEISQAFFIIQSGQVRECGQSSDSKVKEKEKLIINNGHCFGEASILAGLPSSRYFLAESESCTVIYIPQQEFLTFVIEHPGVLVVLYRILAEKQRKRDKKIDEMLKPGVQGDLSTQNFMDIAMSFQNAQKTGVVMLKGDKYKAFVGFNNGMLCYARTPSAEGEAVLDDILTWTEGEFSFETTDRIESVNIQGDTTGLLLDSLRRIDEAAMGSEENSEIGGLFSDDDDVI